MRLLTLHDFRSWAGVTLELTPGRTVLVGPNGFGKTNVVEALMYLSTLSSHRVASDQPLIRDGAESARLSATAVNLGRELRVDLEIQNGKANRARISGSPCRPREILGIVTTVLFAPEDLSLVRGDPDSRRRFVDALVATRSPRLAAVRADYDRVLRQRSALLKSVGGARRAGGASHTAAMDTLEVWDGQLAELGGQLLQARLAMLAELAPHVEEAYLRIAPQSRRPHFRYQSSLGQHAPSDAVDEPAALAEALRARMVQERRKEIERGVSLIGPHRDDVELLLGDNPAKGYASHGEGWSYALALKLASFELLRAHGTDPVLILDDVFAELDRTRRKALADLAQEAEQVIITAAVAEDVPEALDAAQFTVTMENGVSALARGA